MPKLTDQEQRQAAKEFYEQWKDRSDEKKDTQSFWLDLLRVVYGVDNPSQFISFEKTVKFEKTKKFADGYIAKTKILIEQKSGDINLAKGELQSDGAILRPDQQARRYANNLPYDEKPKYIITSNFKEIWVYDENRPHSDPEKILLKDLPKEYYRLQFIVDTGNAHIKKEMELSIKAGEIVGEFYNALHDQYRNPDDPESLKSLNKLCVRLVFCLYAEDAGLFGHKGAFHDYLAHYDAEDCREAIRRLFNVLNQKPEERDPYLKKDLAAFPYVNGGLFDGNDIEIPQFANEIRDLILEKASDDFDWSEISPTIFGAVFESTLNPETRRKGGMHYTSIENIHKVIDPLFYNELCKEFEDIKEIKIAKTRNQKLEEFRDKLASLTFLDPACGSGNFLTETYLSLRRLENEAIELLQGGRAAFGLLNPIKVQISQFYGIEINDFAVTVAKTALWIAEAQMMQKTAQIMYQNLEFFPLKAYTNIIEGNALEVNWNDVIPAEKLSYIMGNPPFIGASMMTAEQKEEAVSIFGKIKLANSIDYVAAWYFLAAKYIQGTSIHCAFVSTNSITQGEQTAAIWGELFTKYGIQFDYAYKSFAWENEARNNAAVTVIIIGFSVVGAKEKILFDNGLKKKAKNINPYLLDAPNTFIYSRSTPICNVPPMTKGNQPSDGGNLIISSQEEKDAIIAKEPNLAKYIHPFIGAEELLKNKVRYCFWLVNVKPEDIRKSPELKRRLEGVRNMRLKSTAAPTRKMAEKPHLFFSLVQPKENYLMIPRVTSSARKYIPIELLDKNTIASDNGSIIPSGDLYYFGVLISNIHMAWMKTTCGRFGMGYRYSGGVVYNNFPWPTPNEKQKEEIEKTAKTILDIRKQYPDSTLADLYDDISMPPKLRKAHLANDKAVMEAYGFFGKVKSESECVAKLMDMYQELTNK